MANDLDVCVCTYRRPSLEATLCSLAQQRLTSVSFRIIVADNDVEETARPVIEAWGARFQLNVLYVHAPARNISVARNACLAAASAPWIAFIDDDEEASPTWLAELLKGAQATGADALFGPVEALYGQSSPPWLALADLHSTRPKLRKDGAPVTGYTSNVLFKRAAAVGLTFDPALGRSGGEDTLFFDAMERRGAKLRYWSDAVVQERVSADRARSSWLLRRSFRSGQTHGQVLRRSGLGPARAGGLALIKGLYCLGAAAACIRDPSGRLRALHRGALHLGVLASSLGKPDLQIYEGAGSDVRPMG